MATLLERPRPCRATMGTPHHGWEAAVRWRPSKIASVPLFRSMVEREREKARKLKFHAPCVSAPLQAVPPPPPPRRCRQTVPQITTNSPS